MENLEIENCTISVEEGMFNFRYVKSIDCNAEYYKEYKNEFITPSFIPTVSCDALKLREIIYKYKSILLTRIEAIFDENEAFKYLSFENDFYYFSYKVDSKTRRKDVYEKIDFFPQIFLNL